MSLLRINMLILLCIFIIFYCYFITGTDKDLTNYTIDVVIIDSMDERINTQALSVLKYMNWVERAWVLTDRTFDVSMFSDDQQAKINIVNDTLQFNNFMQMYDQNISDYCLFLDNFVLPINKVQKSDLFSDGNDKYRVFNVVDQQKNTITLRDIYQDISPVILINKSEFAKFGNIKNYLLHHVINETVVYAPFLNHTHLIIKGATLTSVSNCECTIPHKFATYLYQEPLDQNITAEISKMFRLEFKQ
jgi:hypothetical protein